MKDKYLKPFSVNLYNELFDSDTSFQVVNGKNEPVDVISTKVTTNGESDNVLYQTIDGSYFTVNRNGKHAEDPTFCDLYIKTTPPYKPFTDRGLANIEKIKQIMDMVCNGELLKIELEIQGDTAGKGHVILKVHENPKKYGTLNFSADSYNDIESFINGLTNK